MTTEWTSIHAWKLSQPMSSIPNITLVDRNPVILHQAPQLWLKINAVVMIALPLALAAGVNVRVAVEEPGMWLIGGCGTMLVAPEVAMIRLVCADSLGGPPAMPVSVIARWPLSSRTTGSAMASMIGGSFTPVITTWNCRVRLSAVIPSLITRSMMAVPKASATVLNVNVPEEAGVV